DPADDILRRGVLINRRAAGITRAWACTTERGCEPWVPRCNGINSGCAGRSEGRRWGPGSHALRLQIVDSMDQFMCNRIDQFGWVGDMFRFRWVYLQRSSAGCELTKADLTGKPEARSDFQG